MHQLATVTSREKLIEMGDLSRISTVYRQWYDHQTRIWEETPAYHSFCINRMRSIQDWPNRNPTERIFNIDYQQYKIMWFNVCLWID